MRKRKTFILFTVVAATFALFAYTNVEASEECVPGLCIELRGFEIRTAELFYDNSAPNTSIFNYEVRKVSGKSKRIKFIDILVPGSIDPQNVETWFGGVKVYNKLYGIGEGTAPPSNAWAAVSDGRALRAYTKKGFKVDDEWVPFSVRFSQAVGSGSTYLQLTVKSSRNFASGKIPGPEPQVASIGDIGQSSYEEVPVGTEKFCINYLDNKVYDCKDKTTPLIGKRITKLRVKGTGITEGDLTDITNKIVIKQGNNTCYPWCYNGYYYTICY